MKPQNKSKPTLIFMGTPEFARVSLSALHREGYSLLSVFTQPDKPMGRGQKLSPPPCAQFAKENKIPLFQPDDIKNEAILHHFLKMNPDFIIVVAYGKYLPEKIIQGAKIGCLNIHASLLPKYRGAAPIPWAIIHGETTTGVSLMKVTHKMDAGPIYCQKSLPISPSDTTGSLTAKLAQLGGELLLEALPKIFNGELQPTEQNEKWTTHAPMLKKKDGQIVWNSPSSAIIRLVRGMNPWPSAYTFIDFKLLKIYSAEEMPEIVSGIPGTVYFLSKKGIHVVCQGSSVCITEVQLEGKKRMPADEFVRGYRLKEGMKFSSTP